MFFKPLRSVFSGDNHVFSITKESGNFPLYELPLAKVAFLDEHRFDPEVVSWATMCLWFDGSAVPIGRPQNQRGIVGNYMYRGSAPIFVTTNLQDLESLERYAECDPASGAPWNADASMMCRRLKVYRFTERIPKPARAFPFCARCFATFVKSQAAFWRP